jgi:hypothetical protein
VEVKHPPGSKYELRLLYSLPKLFIVQPFGDEGDVLAPRGMSILDFSYIDAHSRSLTYLPNLTYFLLLHLFFNALYF